MIRSHRRRGWACRRCRVAYPCPAERDRLLAAYGNTAVLRGHMYRLWEQAVAELPQVPVWQLYDQLVAWTRPAAQPRTGAPPADPVPVGRPGPLTVAAGRPPPSHVGVRPPG